MLHQFSNYVNPLRKLGGIGGCRCILVARCSPTLSLPHKQPKQGYLHTKATHACFLVRGEKPLSNIDWNSHQSWSIGRLPRNLRQSHLDQRGVPVFEGWLVACLSPSRYFSSCSSNRFSSNLSKSLAGGTCERNRIQSGASLLKKPLSRGLTRKPKGNQFGGPLKTATQFAASFRPG